MIRLPTPGRIAARCHRHYSKALGEGRSGERLQDRAQSATNLMPACCTLKAVEKAFEHYHRGVAARRRPYTLNSASDFLNPGGNRYAARRSFPAAMLEEPGSPRRT